VCGVAKNQVKCRVFAHPRVTANPAFAEAPAWRLVGEGWRPLFGNFRSLGFSFEWHSFKCREPLDWARSFHPGSVELCLNLAGRAIVRDGQHSSEFGAQTLAFYYQGEPPLIASRCAGDLHQFITVEFAPEFLMKHLFEKAEDLHPLVRAAVRKEAKGSAVSSVQRMATSFLSVVETLRHPPVFAPAQAIWFKSKAVELAAQVFFQPPDGELFCTRAQRAARERVERVRAILRERLSNPPQLEELGKMVGCSQFYLSRSFSQETGMTIQQYIRQVRMERAAELLRSGKCNVTEAAFEVGYNSLSHFSTTFHETFGCCPGLYPLKTPTQKAGSDSP
jgi:AraC-like DNA-binding protein/catechol 2,3-dioxygenase-like lactoylglutathione lyase family enzyme